MCLSCPGLSRPAEKQNVAVRISDFEATQAVMCIPERCAEGCAVTGKLGGKGIRVWRINEGIPPHRWMTLRIRHQCDVAVGFNEQLRSVAADDGKKWIPVRLLKCRLKSELFAIKGDGVGQRC